jgi:hypothetical protein
MPPKRQTDTPHCTACGGEMDLTLFIPPFGSPWGLKIYTCRKCGRTQDYLIPAPLKAA